MISVIVPFYNEERMLSENFSVWQGLSRQAELIFVDAESLDKSADIARQHGRVFNSKKGRALQMNYGVTHAAGDILMFLHADNVISPETLRTIERKIREGHLGGCLTQLIDHQALVYRLIEWQGNLRARMTKEFYGDQGIFVRKDTFLKLGGFPEVPIMEDMLFTRKLRQCGKTVVLPDKILVSARRWERKGVFKTALIFNLMILLFWLKVPLERIKRFYEDIR